MRSMEIDISNGRGRPILDGVIHAPDSEASPKLIIMSNAFCSIFKEYPIYQEFPLEATKRGYEVIQYDFAGLGKSRGEYRNTTVASQIKDLESVMRPDVNNKKICLLGHSLGGIVSSNANQEGVGAIVLWNSPVNMTRLHEAYRTDIETTGTTTRQRGNRSIVVGREMWQEFATITHNEAAFQNTPVLYVAGSEDRTKADDFAARYFTRSKNATAITIAGADHNFENDKKARQQAIKTTLDWLDMNLV